MHIPPHQLTKGVPCLPFLYGSLMLATFCAGEKGLFSLSPPHQGIVGE